MFRILIIIWQIKIYCAYKATISSGFCSHCVLQLETCPLCRTVIASVQEIEPATRPDQAGEPAAAPTKSENGKSAKVTASADVKRRDSAVLYNGNGDCSHPGDL